MRGELQDTIINESTLGGSFFKHYLNKDDKRNKKALQKSDNKMS